MSTHLDLDGLTAVLVTEQERHKVVGGRWEEGLPLVTSTLTQMTSASVSTANGKRYKTTQVSTYKPAPLVTSYLQPRRDDNEPSARQPAGTSL